MSENTEVIDWSTPHMDQIYTTADYAQRNDAYVQCTTKKCFSWNFVKDFTSYMMMPPGFTCNKCGTNYFDVGGSLSPRTFLDEDNYAKYLKRRPKARIQRLP